MDASYMSADSRQPSPHDYRELQTTGTWSDLAEETGRIIAERRISTVFQPIRSLSDGKVIGYEALSRGPAGGPLTSPGVLFGVAEQTGQLLQLERLCRESALRSAEVFDPRLKLFLNIDPRVVNQPDFHPGLTRELLNSAGRPSSSVVLEITERSAISDFRSFRKALRHYSRQGYHVAIDDLGSGYSSLQAIVELKPQFLKIDRSLVQGVARARTKQVLIEALTMIAKRLGCRTVAEGIETSGELAAVIALGVDFGQGYLLGRPGAVVREEELTWPL